MPKAKSKQVPRRPHRKSRLGCKQCKHRHVKCDETQPQCVNCTTANLRCQFRDDAVIARPPSIGVNVDTPPSSADTGGNESPELQYLNLEHIELIHHYSTVTYRTLSSIEHHQKLLRTIPVQHALAHPFLMRQILAISALHLSTIDLERRQHLQRRATEYHTTALSGCISELSKTNSDNWGAVFLFSCFNTSYLLADPARSAVSTPEEYIAGYLRSVDLSRNIKALLESNWHDSIRKSGLWNLIGVDQTPLNPLKSDLDFDLEPEISRYLSFIRASDLDPTIKDQCDEPLTWLYTIFSDYRTGDIQFFRKLMAWPILISDSFIGLLKDLQPEALIILSYYGILLDYHRDHWWAIGETAGHLFDAIRSLTGTEWDQWLEWPRKEIKVDALPSGSSLAQAAP